MRLKFIEILGFKSFADKVKIEFHPGITAIVGPNGCGKSNIADAFRWVLGEQSAKSMRGSKMPDVIFAGTSTRKPLNFAEVTITLTDVDGFLPTDYEEISITRRLHRNGESDYFINRHPVRLKDVQSLFLDSGMGKDAYSIFEQGKIDQVINYTPLERRYIFEEAAGILRFLHRKRDALRKLEQSDLNITRVKDIHLEVEKQIIVLERQAEKAKIYKQNKAQLEDLEKSVFVAKWDHLQKRSVESGKKEADLKKQIEEVNAHLEKLQAQLQEAKTFCAEGEKALKIKSEEVYKARSDKEIKSREKQSALEGLKDAIAKEKRWQQELDMMQDKRTKRQGEQQHVQKMQKDFEGELLSQESILKTLRTKVQGVESEVGHLREQHQALQQELLKITQEESRNESEFKQSTMRLEGSQERKEQILERQEKTAQHIKEMVQQAAEKQKQVKEISHGIDDQKQLFKKLEQDQQDLMEAINRSQTVLEASHKEMTEIKARHKVLLKLREEMEGFSTGSKRLLQEALNPQSPLYQKLKGLYEFITPQEGAEEAVAAVMRPYAQTLVVLTGRDFEAVLEFAAAQQLKDFSLICLEYLEKGSNEKQGDASLLDWVAFNEISKHFLSSVLLAKNTSAAFQLVKQAPGSEIWVEEGALIDRHRVIFYTTQSEKSVFMREAELKFLDKRLGECENSKSEQEGILKGLQTRKAYVQNERLELDKSIRKSEMKLVEFNFSFQRLNTDLEKAKSEAKQLGEELRKIDSVVEQLTITLRELQQRHGEAKAKVADVHKRAGSLASELEKKIIGLKQEQGNLQEKEASFHKLAEEHRKAQHALHVLEVKDLEGIQQEKRLEEEIKNNRDLQSHFKVKSTEYEQILQTVEKLLAEVMSATKGLEQEVVHRHRTVEKMDGTMQEVRNRLKKLENELYQSSVHTAQADASRQTLEAELQERFHLTIEAVRDLGLAVEKSVEHAEKQIRALRNEIESSGDINMTSIEEFDKHKARYEFLNQQMDDLNVSKQELVHIITQLDKESRKIFQETFEKVRANFQKNFKILFNGGEADLQFTETADVLEAGIEIIAKPPGKQMRSINLLSGGEKCLTAMALLFAIFEVKPAPYCILDEIDAPLDDTNIERFVNVVKQFIDRCQFIIITHNKRTMAIADILFGVSMEERGVSKLLSLEFSEQPVAVEIEG